MLLHKDVPLAGRALCLRCKSQLHHSSAGASEAGPVAREGPTDSPGPTTPTEISKEACMRRSLTRPESQGLETRRDIVPFKPQMNRRPYSLFLPRSIINLTFAINLYVGVLGPGCKVEPTSDDLAGGLQGGEGELLYCSAPGQCSQSIYISTLAPALPFVQDAPPCCCCCCCSREVTDSHTGTFSRSGHTETTSTLILGIKEKLHQMKCIIAQKQSF
ncbi:hypothetical protein CRENBAI_019529 [Crenichthys baileyi]|uniref:Uncharacterized protein n=1 Tax=Crenichthys baileyi TaxID=28760 RepID=A0AAV9R3A5_9TELE